VRPTLYLILLFSATSTRILHEMTLIPINTKSSINYPHHGTLAAVPAATVRHILARFYPLWPRLRHGRVPHCGACWIAAILFSLAAISSSVSPASSPLFCRVPLTMKPPSSCHCRGPMLHLSIIPPCPRSAPPWAPPWQSVDVMKIARTDAGLSMPTWYCPMMSASTSTASWRARSSFNHSLLVLHPPWPLHQPALVHQRITSGVEHGNWRILGQRRPSLYFYFSRSLLLWELLYWKVSDRQPYCSIHLYLHQISSEALKVSSCLQWGIMPVTR